MADAASDTEFDVSMAAAPAIPSTSANAEYRARSQSAAVSAQPETESEKQARLGPPVIISVEMVSDPRQPNLAVNAASKALYEAAFKIRVRQNESFADLFNQVAQYKVCCTWLDGRRASLKSLSL